MRINWTAICLLVLAIPASAATITSIDPPVIPVATPNWFVDIYGTELGDSVIFDGASGPIQAEVLGKDEQKISAWVPDAVAYKAGVYSVIVRGAAGDSNPVRFEVKEDGSKLFLVLLMPDPVVVPATSTRGAIVEFEVIPYGGRDPNPTVTCSPASGTLFPRGPSQSHCVARNSFGEQTFGTVHIFVYDGAGPVVLVPDRIVVAAENAEGTVVTFSASAHDFHDGEVPVTCTPASGSRFPIGVTEVQCIAKDSSLNYGEGLFEIEVTGDDPDPGTLTIQVPNRIVAEATSGAGVEVRFTVTASGTDDPQPMISCDPVSGSTFPLGTTRVLCIATDRFGNTARGEFDVTVVDTTPPELMLSDVAAEASGDSAVVTYTPTATDIVDGNVPVTCTPPSGSRFPRGQSTVQCSATDRAGNTATGSFTVRVGDSIPPHIASVTATPDVLSPANHKLVDVTVSVDVMDANDPMPQCRVISVTANENVDAPGSGSTDLDWILTGGLTLKLRAERSGEGSARVYTVWVTCSDASGNESLSSVDVTVPKGNSSSGQTTTTPTTKKRRSARS